MVEATMAAHQATANGGHSNLHLVPDATNTYTNAALLAPVPARATVAAPAPMHALLTLQPGGAWDPQPAQQLSLQQPHASHTVVRPVAVVPVQASLTQRLNGMGTDSGIAQQRMEQPTGPSRVAPAPGPIPPEVRVVCGNIVASFVVERMRVRLPDGQEVSPTEFERIGGKAASKKWKTSLRLVKPDGSAGQLIGDWLQSHNLLVQRAHKSVLPKIPPAALHHAAQQHPQLPHSHHPQQPAVVRPPLTAAAASVAQPHHPLQAGRPLVAPVPRPPPDVIAHLLQQYIGFLPGDPTAAPLPPELPSFSTEATHSIYDIRNVTYKELMDMSLVSAPNPLGAMLPVPPSVLPGRQAYMAGDEPPKRQRTNLMGSAVGGTGAADSVDAAVAHAELVRYLTGERPDAPWEALGFPKPPIIAGKELDLRALHRWGQQLGGYKQISDERLWSRICAEMGIDVKTITNGAYLLKGYYKKVFEFREPEYLLLGTATAAGQHPSSPPGNPSTTAEAATAAEQSLSGRGGIPARLAEGLNGAELRAANGGRHSPDDVAGVLSAEPSDLGLEDVRDFEDGDYGRVGAGLGGGGTPTGELLAAGMEPVPWSGADGDGLQEPGPAADVEDVAAQMHAYAEACCTVTTVTVGGIRAGEKGGSGAAFGMDGKKRRREGDELGLDFVSA